MVSKGTKIHNEAEEFEQTLLIWRRTWINYRFSVALCHIKVKSKSLSQGNRDTACSTNLLGAVKRRQFRFGLSSDGLSELWWKNANMIFTAGAPDVEVVGSTVCPLEMVGWVFEIHFYVNSNGHLMGLILNLNINAMQIMIIFSVT